MRYISRRALSLLRAGVGDSGVRFRTGQEEAVRHVVEGKGRLLVVQKTGWGKSFVYFIATMLLREAGLGPTLLVSPLLALMRNQILAAERMGIRAETINSNNRERWSEVEEAVRRDETDILIISPERLANERFLREVLWTVANRVSLLVIDEAHCISDWGHDFRPHYRLIEGIVRTLPPNLRLLATTATANDRVMADLEDILGPNLEVSRGDLSRPSLTLQTIRLPSQSERLAWLADQLRSLSGSGIVYTLTVRDAELVASWLRSRGLNVAAYTSRSGAGRPELEQALLDNELKALVATTALGMGFDKPDLAFVIHYQAPGSVVAYYQQVGRAGRALRAAYGVLLSGHEDTEIADYFIRSAFPTENEVDAVVSALEDAPDGLSFREIQMAVNVSYRRIEKTFQLLSLESPAPIAKLGAKWQLTAATLSQEFWNRARRLTDLRHTELAQMQEYIGLPSGHMEFLIRSLDGESKNVFSPNLPNLSTTVAPQRVREAVAFLRRNSLIIRPRRTWPPGKRIDRDHQAERGRALSAWADDGWGDLVRQGKYVDNRFSDSLVDACVSLVRQWRPDPFPEWVTAVPSYCHPDLVPDFARRLAAALGLPFRVTMVKKEDRPEQKTMENSDKQARNIVGSVTVDKTAILKSPVLLMDDIVDSRWTFTVLTWELRRRGCDAVWPLALADAGGTQ
ncbi:MAG: RecQ family ATP-dependent DNA helicase [Acidobacteriota bacterium]|nr:RecQ family ATP-dependent DNA helicase [Acidobacteriota bacterium]